MRFVRRPRTPGAPSLPSPRYPAKRRFVDYFNENFHITTSGNFRTQTLIDAILEVGADRILFSTDWPFENIDHASDWFNATSIAEADRVKIGRTNARQRSKLFAWDTIAHEHMACYANPGNCLDPDRYAESTRAADDMPANDVPARGGEDLA